MAVDAADNVYVSGEVPIGGFDQAVVRSYKPTGALRWHAGVADSAGGTAFPIILVKGRNVYVAGSAAVTGGTTDLIAMKYSTAGARGWASPHELDYTNGGWSSGIAVDSTGAVIVAGWAYSFGTGGHNVAALWKLSSGGATAWHREFDDAAWGDGEFDAVVTDSQDRIYAAGGADVGGGTGNLVLARYTAAGDATAVWRSAGAGSGYCTFTTILRLSDTSIVAAGDVWDGGASQAGLYKAKTTSP